MCSVDKDEGGETRTIKKGDLMRKGREVHRFRMSGEISDDARVKKV